MHNTAKPATFAAVAVEDVAQVVLAAVGSFDTAAADLAGADNFERPAVAQIELGAPQL